VRQGGTFTVSGLIPSNHSLSVRLRDPDGRPPEWGLSRATVSDGDVSGVVVRTSRGATASGRVVFEGAATPPAGNVDIHVYEVGEDPPDLSSRLTTVGGDGTFILTPLFDECLIGVSGVPGWTLKAITVNGRDVTDTPMTVDGGESISGATIVLTDRVTHASTGGQYGSGGDVVEEVLPEPLRVRTEGGHRERHTRGSPDPAEDVTIDVLVVLHLSPRRPVMAGKGR